MKSTSVFTIAFILAVCSIFSNCSPDYTFVQSTEETLTRNGWSVDYYYQQQDMTTEFGSYRITFNSDGQMNIREGSNVFSGTWNRVVSSVQTEIIGIDISCSNQNLNMLSGSWVLKTQTSSTISFEDNHPNISFLRIKKQP